MSIQIIDSHSVETLQCLRHCYKFLNEGWQRARREQIPDQGFEERLRESCVVGLPKWRISQPWELQLGSNLETSSGTNHEIDLVVEQANLMAIVEAKNRTPDLPTKNDVIVFFAKILDYLTCNPIVLLQDVCAVFVSAYGFERSGLAACLGLGIHPVAPSLRPLPILIQSARLMRSEVEKGCAIGSNAQQQIADFCANVNRMSSILEPTWFNSRYGFQSETTIVSKAVGGLDTIAMSEQFRELNGQCSQLLSEVKNASASITR